MDEFISRQKVLEGLACIAKANARSDAQKSLMGRVMFFTENLPSVSTEKTDDYKQGWHDAITTALQGRKRGINMADIELVIKISEEVYNNIQSHDCKNGERWYSEEWIAIHKGTPLPKGHGRLIDYGYVVDAIDDWVNAEEYRYTNATDYLRNRIENVPTIIEADEG